MFIEKYPDIVTVYSIGDFSKELCGGPHVKNTSELGHFKIVKEDAPNMDSQGDFDHRDYIIGKFGGIFNRYVSQLKKIMNSEQEIKTPV